MQFQEAHIWDLGVLTGFLKEIATRLSLETSLFSEFRWNVKLYKDCSELSTLSLKVEVKS